MKELAKVFGMEKHVQVWDVRENAVKSVLHKFIWKTDVSYSHNLKLA